MVIFHCYVSLPEGLMVETSHPQLRNIGEIPFFGYIWILRVW